MKLFFEGLASGIVFAAIAIVFAEIKFDYSVGDKVKDLFLSEEHKAEAAYQRARARLGAAQSRLLAKVKKVF